MPHHVPLIFLRLPPAPVREKMVRGEPHRSRVGQCASHVSRFWRFLGWHDSQSVELLLGCGLAAYGGWIALPGYDSLLTGSTYSVLRAVASEALIGGALCALGIGHVLLALAYRLWPRLVAAWLNMMVWLFLAAFLWLGSGGPSAGAALFLILALYGAWSYWRLRGMLQSRREQDRNGPQWMQPRRSFSP